MDKEEVFPIGEYLDTAIRRKWFIIIPFILSLILTTGLYWKLPKIYRSDTLILVLPQKVPQDYVKPTVTTPIQYRLKTITEEILSRTRLETIINELNLYPELRKTTPIEQIIAKMRKDIEIKEKGESSFRIYYQGKDPETVRRVTSKLASLFIEENLKTRQQQAQITTDFLSHELALVEKKLKQQEKAITAFKSKHIESLPEQRESNLAMLRQLCERRQTIMERINIAENQKTFLQHQLASLDRFIYSDTENQIITPNSSVQSQLAAAQNQLLALKNIYTDNHIEIRKLKEKINQLKKQLESNNKENQEIQQVQMLNPRVLELKTQLMTINMEIKRLKEEEVKLKKQISIYEKRLEQTPHVELQLADLTRDYNNTKRFYEELLQKKMYAKQAENLERRQQGEQFRILDPAVLPKIPYKPNPYRLFPIGIFLGLGCGFGLAFVVEMLDNSFRNPKEVEEYLGIPVLASIPVIKKKAKLFWS